MAFNLPSRRTVTEETVRRDKQDLAKTVTSLRQNWTFLCDAIEQVATLCGRMEIDHQLGDIIATFRKPVEAPDELPLVKPPEPTVLPVNSYAPHFDWAKTLPKVALTDLELRVLLRECGVAYKDDYVDRMNLGQGAQFKALPSTQRFLRRFREGFHRMCPDATLGTADALLTRLGFRGDFIDELADAVD